MTKRLIHFAATWESRPANMPTWVSTNAYCAPQGHRPRTVTTDRTTVTCAVCLAMLANSVPRPVRIAGGPL